MSGPNGVAPFLLTMPTYGGSLAAARCLGEHGIPVTMAGDAVLAPARWSRHVKRWVSCPPVLDTDRFVDWLFEFGQREPGHVLYATCDDLAWLFAERAPELEKHYRLFGPSVEVIERLLDKKSLYGRALEVGLETLPTAFPENVDEAVSQAARVGFPLLLKPRTQIYLPTRSKGVFVSSAKDLPREYAAYLPLNPFYPPLMRRIPGIELPMLQAFRPDAAENIYSISGFIGETGADISVRAAVKVMQRPRRLGVGLCFEEAPVDGATLERLVHLCRAAGYYGVFEAEFVRSGTHYHLIDFNPRFYGQMGFETARRLPLPYLVWLGATGRSSDIGGELSRANEFKVGNGYVYCNQLFFRALLVLQRAGGRMTKEEAQRWREWLKRSNDRLAAFDSVDAPDDHLPAFVSAVNEIYSAARHPRSFLRQMVIGP